MPGQVVDYLPEPQMEEVRNLASLRGCWWWTSGRATAMGGRRCLSAATGAEVSGDVHRPGILLQCGRVDVSGCAAAGRVRAQPGVRAGAGVGEL